MANGYSVLTKKIHLEVRLEEIPVTDIWNLLQDLVRWCLHEDRNPDFRRVVVEFLREVLETK